MNKLTYAVIASIVALGLSACSGSDRQVDSPVEPIEGKAETAAMDRFTEFKDSLKSITSFRAQSVIKADDGTQNTDLHFDRPKSSFSGKATIDSGSMDMSIDLVRASGLLWIKGPKEYWEAFGCDASPALGKYVVFQASQGDQVAKYYDVDLLVTTVERMSTGEVTVDGEIDKDGSKYLRYTLGESGKSTLLDLPSSGEIDSATLVSRADGVDATIDIDEFNKEVDVSIPASDEVAQPQN